MSKINCAVYVRKSTEKGLEQEFNSLHNQEEACKNYILSQAFNQWEYSKTYEDGGISGGTMKRPGLVQMIEDIKVGKVNVVVVYKVDRLSRSIMDFHKMMKSFEQYRCNFVSITQAFDTSTSMGKLTLNMLLSFAQFEREVASERVRDKIASSKAKGLWMGGVPPLGYINIEKKLVIEENEANKVRMIFDRYLALKNMQAVRDEMNDKGLFTKTYTTKNKSNQIGGKPWTTGRIRQVLKNVLYLGKTKHGDQIYKGEHEAIISEELFNNVQEIMKENGNNTGGKKKSRLKLFLRDKVFFGEEVMKHISGKKLHYYSCNGLYVRIDHLDEIVINAVGRYLHIKDNGLTRAEKENLLYVDFEGLDLRLKKKLVKQVTEKVVFEEKGYFRLVLRREALNKLDTYKGVKRQKERETSFETMYVQENEVTIRLPFKPPRGKSRIEGLVENKKVQPDLVEAISLGWRYKQTYENGKNLRDIEQEENRSRRTVRRYLNLGYLSPTIIKKTLNGELKCSVGELEKASCYIDWKEQEASLGL
jgi:DNA invertase Pin-like site-specific DNA recombinase